MRKWVPGFHFCAVMCMSDLHWLAGLLEGEGSFCKGAPSRPNKPFINVEMTDREVMEHVGQIMDHKIMTIRPRRDNWAEAYRIRICGKPAVQWMHQLRPLMGSRRQAQIDTALACYVVYRPGRKSRA